MKCGKCGCEAEPSAKFCPVCGNSLAALNEQKTNNRRTYTNCPVCGNIIPFGSRICPSCGGRTDGQPKKSHAAVIAACAGTAVVVALAAVAVALSVTDKPSDEPPIYRNEVQPVYSAAQAPQTAEPTYEPLVTPMPIQPEPVIQPTPIVVRQAQTGSSGADSTYDYPSNSRYITVSELSAMSRSSVRRVLNEMYARHGYIFTTDENRNYFSSKSWYTPRYTNQADAEAHFNSYEKENKKTIVNYEESKGWR